MHAHVYGRIYTRVHVPRTNRGEGTHACEHPGAASPLPSPTSKPPSSLQCHCAVLLPHTGSGLAEGMARRAKSQGRVSPELLGAHDKSTCFSWPAPATGSKSWPGRGTSPPAPGRHVPHPQLTLWLEASGSPKWGAHDVQSWGRRGSEWAPLCQPGSGQAGRTLRPDATEKEITASAGPGPLPSYSSRRAGGQGVIKGGLGLPCASGPKGNLLNVAPAPQVI